MLKSSWSEVYVGTNRGFVFLADIKNLRPITSFRPFSQDVRSFWIFHDSSSGLDGSAFNESDTESLHSNASKDEVVQKDKEKIVITATSSVSSSKDIEGCDESSSGRGVSPTPSSSDKDVSNGKQLVVGIGKGFSNLIEKNIALVSSVKKKPRAYALLWSIIDAWE